MTKQSQPWVSLDKVEAFVQLEPALIILSLVLGAWLVSKILLRNLSIERKRNLKKQFKNLTFHLVIAVPLFAFYMVLEQLPYESHLIEKVMTYTGLLAIFWGCIVFVKTSRILVFEYLLLRHMKVAFPVLLVNLFTLLLSIILSTWIGAEIFNIRLAPLLATSAIFSLVVGLALQDTLGNLFAGVALQFDKPYQIGDWIEVHNGAENWAGQVFEISWRATVLISFTNEAITVPNRVMSQAQIANFATHVRPVIRSQIFRLPFGSPISKIKEVLMDSIEKVASIRKTPAPFVLVFDTDESSISFKLVYYLNDYGDKFLIADEVYTNGLNHLEANGFKLANHRITLINQA